MHNQWWYYDVAPCVSSAVPRGKIADGFQCFC